MRQAQLLHILEWGGVVFGVDWLSVGRRVKPPRPAESPIYRAFRLLLLVITFTLLFANWTAVGPLGNHFLPQIRSLDCLGFVLALTGLAIAAWARVSLGQYWSDKIVLKVDHQLIRSGPYARMRHPIYSGVLLGVLGTALVIGEIRGLL